ncbi:MAG: ZIP family metal transporter [Elusimicrobiota bacterium]
MIPALAFSFAAVLSTLAGGLLILRKKDWAQKHLWRFLAFGSGTLLGITFLHLLPEAWKLDARWAGGMVVTAFVAFFILEEFVVVHACRELVEDCRVHSLGYTALAALALHGAADGLAIAFSFHSSRSLGTLVAWAVVVHKFSDGLTLSSLFRGTGHSPRKTLLLTAALALATPAGAALSLTKAAWITPSFLAGVLGLAGGGFLYVSAADILPRLHRSRDRLCWVFLAAGASIGALFGH